MPEYRRAFFKGGTYFFTVVTYQRTPIFIDDSTIECLNQCITATIQDYPFNIEASVMLPDHIHAIWTLPETDQDFSKSWMVIKKRFSIYYSNTNTHSVSESMMKKREKGIWQRRFWEHLIRDEEDLNKHYDYIHFNPVKHGLVGSPELWKYSSFNQFVNQGLYPPVWGTNEPERIQGMNYE